MNTATRPSEVGPTAAPPAPGRRSKPRRELGGYLFIAPAVIYLAVLLLVPLARGIQLSLTDTKLVNPSGGSFVGLENYSELVESGQFWSSLFATLLYTSLTVVFAVTLGTMAAALINRPFRGRALFRAVMTFPYAMPTVAVALIYVWIYNQSGGVMNRSLSVLGIGQQGWLTDPQWGMFSVVLATVWKVFPFVMLVMLAALQGVPDELYEAARIDGAGPLATFRCVVIPHLAPTLRIVALLMTIWSIRRFEIIFLLTGGGPVDKTNTLVINVYRRAFSDQDLGVAAAIGVLGLVLSICVTVVFFTVEQRQTRKEAA